MKNLKSQGGYTFIEVMMTVGIFTMMMAALYAGLVAGETTYNSYEAAAVAQREATKAVFSLTRDLRMGTDLTFVTQEDNSLEFNFSHPGDGTVTYTWATSGTYPNQLRRQATSEEDSKLIAVRLSDLDVTEGASHIRIDVTSYVLMDDGSSNTFQLVDKIVPRLE